MRIENCRIAAVAAAVFGLGVGPAAAVGTDTIVGVFSNPIYAGNVLNNPTVGQSLAVDNTGTAVVAISPTGNTLNWGISTSGIPASQDYSSLTFTGIAVPAADATTPEKIGTIFYLNGTSDLNSLIFGATLSFYLNSVSAGNLLASDTVFINTTTNAYSGTGLSLPQLQTDADYVSICGNSSNICGNSIEAYEDSEGGIGLSVDLSGTLMIDPSLTLTSVVATPGQDPAVTGTVGAEASLAVPEPASMAALAAGLLGLAAVRQRRAK